MELSSKQKKEGADVEKYTWGDSIKSEADIEKILKLV